MMSRILSGACKSADEPALLALDMIEPPKLRIEQPLPNVGRSEKLLRNKLTRWPTLLTIRTWVKQTVNAIAIELLDKLTYVRVVEHLEDEMWIEMRSVYQTQTPTV